MHSKHEYHQVKQSKTFIHLVQLEFVNICQEQVDSFFPHHLHGCPQSLKRSISDLWGRIVHLLQEECNNLVHREVFKTCSTRALIQTYLEERCTEWLQNAFWQCTRGAVTEAPGQEKRSLLLDGGVLVVHHPQNILADVLQVCLQYSWKLSF